uniref:Uncharacterized protein n=1 Tax=Cucumis melo TaxID=3656 RepID=A0A9I9EDZ9_CUCME
MVMVCQEEEEGSKKSLVSREGRDKEEFSFLRRKISISRKCLIMTSATRNKSGNFPDAVDGVNITVAQSQDTEESESQ